MLNSNFGKKFMKFTCQCIFSYLCIFRGKIGSTVTIGMVLRYRFCLSEIGNGKR